MASIAETLLSLTARNGGATVSLEDGTVAAHTSGFYVGGAVPSEVFENHGDVRQYEDAVNAIGFATQWLGYVGSWIDADTDTVYIDAVDHIEHFDIAVAVAEQRGELAIWEIAGGTEFRL